MSYLLTDHREKSWFKSAMQAAKAGRDHIYTHGLISVRNDAKEFYAQGYHKAEPYSPKYIPNPYRYQYDLFVHIWLNFYKILDNEILALRTLAVKERNSSFSDKADELLATQTLNGITREDCLFAAAEIRWPTSIDANGGRTGKFVRDPWSERRVKALSHETIKYVAGFGGGGQGKTTVFLGFNLMMFDHYIFTEKGARCLISTTNKDKLNGVSWAYVCNLNRATEDGISLTAGRGKVGGEWTISRPGNKDKAGVFKGLLLGNQINESIIVDKLTGSHGHWFIGYTLDEATSTPQAPLDAALNFTMHAKDFRIQLAANYDSDFDTLGSNIKPEEGWESVTPETGEWITNTKADQPIIVLHFNNDLSPGMTNEGHRLFPYLPSESTLNKNYPKQSSRVLSNLRYRRFWYGWRFNDLCNDKVITERMVIDAGADRPLFLKNNIVDCTFFSFDSAAAELDRNPMMIFDEGKCASTGQRVFGPKNVLQLTKATDSLTYFRESSLEILKICNQQKITSGNGIVDWTGRPGHAEHLHQAGFLVQRMVYNKGLPDGKSIDSITRRVEREIRLGIQVEFKDDMPVDLICAHHVAENCIGFGAWLCRQYIQCGRLKNINKDMLRLIDSADIEQELYSRSCGFKSSIKHGDRFRLEEKKDFRKKFGFSPDILDCLFQGCFFAFMYRNIPLTPVDTSATVIDIKDKNNDIEDLNKLHEFGKLEETYELDQIQFEYSGGSSDDYWNQH